MMVPIVVSRPPTEMHPSSGRSPLQNYSSFPVGVRHHKMAKATFSLPGNFAFPETLRKREANKIISRSDKHDYRNDSNFNDQIARLLRRHPDADEDDNFLSDEIEELNRHQTNHPFLTKEFLQQLQFFGLLPSIIDDDEDDIDELRRTRSDASSFTLRKRIVKKRISVDYVSDEADEITTNSSTCNADSVIWQYKGGLRIVDKQIPSRTCGSDRIDPSPTTPAIPHHRRSFRRRIRRWTIHAPMSSSRNHRCKKGMVQILSYRFSRLARSKLGFNSKCEAHIFKNLLLFKNYHDDKV